jgi:hypothetical protein
MESIGQILVPLAFLALIFALLFSFRRDKRGGDPVLPTTTSRIIPVDARFPHTITITFVPVSADQLEGDGPVQLNLGARVGARAGQQDEAATAAQAA